MSELQEVEVQGTLNADGTLRLDEAPQLPPGRVTVVLRAAGPALPPGAPTNWFDYMEWARKQLEDAGHRFKSGEEIDEYIRDIRDWGEDRLDAARGVSG